MKAAPASFSPFPGLRPFEPDEDHLFFGREKEIDELLRRLRETRFLAVVGSSGSGKSSLVRSGLIPSLHSGFMATAGSSWRVALLRPGEDPIGNLASTLSARDVLEIDEPMAGATAAPIEATLRRSTLGIAEAVRHAKMPAHDNLLVVIDQFEEIFRFRNRDSKVAVADAEIFVKLLLEATSQEDVPIYVVLTMRSDFIGDCIQYSGLPEAINAGQYLVPRMTRDELRSAITGPVAVAVAEMTPRLVLRLLNDVGDDPDQLPVLQHALMRTWDYWQRRRDAEPIDIEHYEAIGTMRSALSLHADEAFSEASSNGGSEITVRMFKALTDTFTDSRGVRRPTAVRELAAICGCSEAELVSIVEIFHRPGRSFLMPPPSAPLESESIVDLSHESLMRCWTRLIEWAEEERISAASYVRLAQAAAWYEDGAAGLWRDPELELGLAWKKQNQPTAAWAVRYSTRFEHAMLFLERSETERNRLLAEKEAERKRRLKYAWSVSAVLTMMLAAALVLGWFASRERARAETNLGLAKLAVDEMLSSAGSDFARVAADVPQLEEFRRELLEKAKNFYTEFTKEKPDREEIRADMALAHFRLGDIHRLLQQSNDAIEEYGKAAEEFDKLTKDFPRNSEYRRLLANTYNWLGETERPLAGRESDADKAYETALRLQQDLHSAYPENTVYQQELARTHYNRGILRSDREGPAAESDFREAIRLLQPLSEMDPLAEISRIRQELARTYNNLGRLLRRSGRTEDARNLYGQAIQIHVALNRQEPEKREYQLELATFYNNLATLLEESGQLEQANQTNRQALDRFEDLAEPVPALGLQLAQAHNLRGRILESQALAADGEKEYDESVRRFERLAARTNSSDFHLMFGQALFNLAARRRERKDLKGAVDLLSRAVTQHLAANSQTDLAYDYLLLAQVQLALGDSNDARTTADNLSRLLPTLEDSDREILGKGYANLRDEIN